MRNGVVRRLREEQPEYEEESECEKEEGERPAGDDCDCSGGKEEAERPSGRGQNSKHEHKDQQHGGCRSLELKSRQPAVVLRVRAPIVIRSLQSSDLQHDDDDEGDEAYEE